MKTTTTLKTMTLALALYSTGALAAGTAPPVPQAVKNMDCLVGKWTGNATMTLGGQSAAVKVTWDCKRVSGGFGLQCNADMTGIPGLGVYHETDLFGYDAGANKYHWFSVTNGGETHDHAAAVSNDSKIQFVYTGVQEGKPFKEVIDLAFDENSKNLELRSESFMDGQSVAVLKGKASKK